MFHKVQTLAVYKLFRPGYSITGHIRIGIELRINGYYLTETENFIPQTIQIFIYRFVSFIPIAGTNKIQPGRFPAFL